MTRILVTSFEPFDGRSLNSSQEVGRALADRPPLGVRLDWLVLPVVTGQCLDRAWEWVEAANPTLVLALGQAAGTAALRIEQQAVNVHDFAIPDNAGNQPRNEFIHLDGPAFYPTTFPAHGVLGEVRRRRVPVQLSPSAGSYVCNHLLYGLLHRAARTGRRHQTGFIHLPLNRSESAWMESTSKASPLVSVRNSLPENSPSGRSAGRRSARRRGATRIRSVF